MPVPPTRRPTLATWSLIVALLAPVFPMIAYFLPTGGGEAGFARAFTHLTLAIAAADVVAIAWSGLAALSLRRHERAAGRLVAGSLAIVASLGLCLAPVVSISAESALSMFLVGVGPAILAGALAFWWIRRQPGAGDPRRSDPMRPKEVEREH